MTRHKPKNMKELKVVGLLLHGFIALTPSETRGVISIL